MLTIMGVEVLKEVGMREISISLSLKGVLSSPPLEEVLGANC